MSITKKMKYKKAYGLLATMTLLSISLPAWSNGFSLPEQNVTNLGLAYAGTGSLAVDASTNYYNAAGLTRLCGDQVVVGGVIAIPRTTLNVTSATDSFGFPMTPGHTRPKNFTAIPSMHYGSKICDQWAWGISMISNFGSKTNYNNHSVARYMATRSEMVTVTLSPSAAYKMNDCFSLGAGFDVMYTAAKLDSKIGINFLNEDGYFKNKGSRNAYGFHLGALYEMDDCTRFGLSYRSRLTPKLKGHALLRNPVRVPVAGVLVAVPQDVIWHRARTTIRLPDTATLSGYHAFNECWAMVADAQWYHWKRYQNLAIRYDDGSRLSAVQDWRNTYRLALGGIYQYDCDWQFKVGTSFDKTSTRDNTRNIYIPDQNQTAAALGARYQWTPCLAVDMGYVHVFYKKAHINQSAATATGPLFPGQPLQSIKGRVKNRIDALGLQLTWDIK
jgi:long-chain fatty acid transport protein